MNRQPNSTLKIAHLNIQSALPKKEELKNFLAHEKIDIMSLNETWLKPNKQFKIPNYEVIRHDRTNSPHGGVALIVHNSISFERTYLQTQKADEYITIKINRIMENSKDLYITSYYCPPAIKINDDLIRKAINIAPDSLLIGDLNAHHQHWHSREPNYNGNQLVNIINSENCSIINTDLATYEPLHRPDYKAILDFCVANDSLITKISNFGITDQLRSDHLTTKLEIEHNCREILNRHASQLKVIRKTDWELFRKIASEEARNINSNEIQSIDQLDHVVHQLTVAIKSSVEQSTTLKEIQINANRLLVLPRHIVQLIKTKKVVRREYQKTRNPDSKTEFNRLTAVVKREIQEHKRKSWIAFCDSINNLQVTDSELWKRLKSIEDKNKPANSKRTTLQTNTTTTQDPEEVANIFANVLEANFKLPPDPTFDLEFREKIDSEVNQKIVTLHSNQSDVQLTDQTEINRILGKIRGRGAPGPDQITNKVIKKSTRRIP